MVNDMSRVLIETLVKKALKDLKDSPERSIRNLVHMALDFSEGRFQRAFFEMAQEFLENEHSSYYNVIQDCASHVEAERLLQFGMNIGYNSCTAGAKMIRGMEANCGFNIPWTVSFCIDGQRLKENPQSYDHVITQGEALGIYTWMLYQQEQFLEILPMIQRHTDSAFVLFCAPCGLTPEFLDSISDINHLMLAVSYEEETGNIYRQLRERQLLYSVYYRYRETDADLIISGELFYSTQQAHPLFTAVFPGSDCSEETGENVYRAVVDARKKHVFQTIAWDLNRDNSYIDSIISDAACSAHFDANGSLCTHQKEKMPFNFFDQDLVSIFRQAFPRQSTDHR